MVRAAIQNEIAVIRSLNHPHIIRVHLTYEDKSRFFIVMDPLADCDLEAFLEQDNQHNKDSIVWKWFLCLSNALAFIHFKGVRHKDIKPRNILVKGEEIFFADFGSSHAFLDGGNSTTEGPSYGHTKMYCAPEVIHQGKRNRSADVFSLGCVFTELLIWMHGPSQQVISLWHDFRETNAQGFTNNAYHASLDKVEYYFSTYMSGPRASNVYAMVVAKMLSAEPRDRITAIQASLAFGDILETFQVEPCLECRLDGWVDYQSHVQPDPSATPMAPTLPMVDTNARLSSAVRPPTANAPDSSSKIESDFEVVDAHSDSAAPIAAPAPAHISVPKSTTDEERPPQRRTFCDACADSKLRCSKDHPTCRRCSANGLQCIYGVSRKRRSRVGTQNPTSTDLHAM
jgi:serine/threonine protein kinase